MISRFKKLFKEADLASKEQKKAVEPAVLDLLEDFQDSVSVKEFNHDDTVPMELEHLFKH